ncbi:outer membrane protein assembly factor BamD [Flavobacterium luminosum]|uniref:Outer membrane protein assembly factor BamD n=1 Tax=Flavobacterium luminosum TaxID=2949086 RepID=A0ABT0TM23_9FLAO|nr:outer membrane protein assembly factor BamD [Flavobacterium sp. HXWNR70]MCL9808532.1 outer membrane protein assembly factor BamD [Flavobacterium sp. HXWNR70]
MNKLLYVFLLVTVLSSCGEYQKALKSEDVALKLEAATKQYEAQKYNKAIRLFEQIAPVYRGKKEAENMFYMFAQSYFKTKQYYLAAYQFESFVSLYPKSNNVEEAAFLSAKSYSKLSPVYSLDQVDTDKAIIKMQAFIDKYPDSQYVAEANTIVKSLTEKLEKKAFEIAKQYNTVSDYKTAIKALDNFLADYPGTIFKEKALFYKLDSSYQLAINSVPSKMQERLNNAKAAYDALIKFNANTEYRALADEMLVRVDKELQQFSK